MTEFHRTRSVMDAFSVFHGRTDEEWLALLQRSVMEDVIDGVRFPRFPAEALQTQFVGSANSQALQEARWFYEELKRQAVSAGTPISEHSKILDFGCGWGRYIRFFWKDVQEEGLFGVDVDPDMECAPGGGQIERLDLTVLAGLPEDGSHDEAPIPQRGVQAAGR